MLIGQALKPPAVRRYLIIELQPAALSDGFDLTNFKPKHAPAADSPIGLMVRCKANGISESFADINGIAVDVNDNDLNAVNCLRESAGSFAIRFSDTPQPAVSVLE